MQKIHKQELYYQIILVDIDLLIPQDSKAAVIDDVEFMSLRHSIKYDPDFLKVRFPFVNTYPGREWIVAGGDKRVKAAIAEGKKKIPVMFVKVDPLKEKEWMVKDNKRSGRWDETELKKEIIQLHEAGYNMESLSYTPDELVPFLTSEETTQDSKDNPDNAGTTPRAKNKIKYGSVVRCPHCTDTFEIGENDIVHAD